jgi:hypothetical protein
MTFFQKPPWKNCWAGEGCGWATWAVLGYGQRGKERERRGGLSPRERREEGFSFFSGFLFLVLFLQFKFKIESV